MHLQCTRADLSGHADYAGEFGDAYQRAAARTARRRGKAPGVCLANPRAALELSLYCHVESRTGFTGILFQRRLTCWPMRWERPLVSLIRSCLKKNHPSAGDERHHLYPVPDQCRRLMVAEKAPAPVTIRWRQWAAAVSILRPAI